MSHRIFNHNETKELSEFKNGLDRKDQAQNFTVDKREVKKDTDKKEQRNG